MVSNCANPKCAKPLHYLRDGRIFRFDVPDQKMAVNGKKTRHIEHYWLCGACSQALIMELSPEGVRLAPRIRPSFGPELDLAGRAIAS
jgi:uncharacterized protein YcsI (UPF0317 family)